MTLAAMGNFQPLGKIKQKFIINANEAIYQTTKEKMAIAEEKNKQIRVKEIKVGKHNLPMNRKMLNNIRASSISPSIDKMKSSAVNFNTSLLSGNRPTQSSRFTPTSVNVDQSGKKIPPNTASLQKIVAIPPKHPPNDIARIKSTVVSANIGGSSADKISPAEGLKSGKGHQSEAEKQPAKIASTNDTLVSGKSVLAPNSGINEKQSEDNRLFNKNTNLFRPIPFTFDPSNKPQSKNHRLPRDTLTHNSPIQESLLKGFKSLEKVEKAVLRAEEKIEKVALKTDKGHDPDGKEEDKIAPVDGAKYSLKDIIIHALALKPCKRAEIILKIEKEHPDIKAPSNEVTGILNSIAVFNSKENAYDLARHAFADLKLECPLYTPAEILFVKRKIPPTSSPKPLDNGKTPPHLKQSKALNVQKGHEKTSHSTEPPSKKSKIMEKVVEIVPIPDYASLEGCQDFLKQYTPVSSHDQRQTYKTDFDKDYTEYLALHKRLKHAFSKFEAMHKKLHTYDHDSKDYKEYKKKFLTEYHQLVNEPESREGYIAKRARFDYLHSKLAHIKGLVTRFDGQSPKNDSKRCNGGNCENANKISKNNRNREFSTSLLETLSEKMASKTAGNNKGNTLIEAS
ncbi:uncharacterized protein LOC135922544 isoform X2 [Gordionus sp. m RMFG-2023]|uniref:uncharacterized protein LOC135922544 isoform X2 n=1 Tax=Gordionus sp. m RMFG-2023 TaxID=3053472 RepID=UPI0031FDE1C4